MSHRIQRINQLIREQISQILLKEFDIPLGTLVTITRIETSKDLENSKLYVSVLPEKEIQGILNLLNRKSYFFHRRLKKILKIKIVPNIKFRKDERTAQADRIEEVLEKIKQEKKRLKKVPKLLK